MSQHVEQMHEMEAQGFFTCGCDDCGRDRADRSAGKVKLPCGCVATVRGHQIVFVACCADCAIRLGVPCQQCGRLSCVHVEDAQ